MMKRLSLRIMIVIAASSALAAIAEAGDAGDRESEGKKFAVVVGIENYDKKAELIDLQFCLEDAREFAKVLKTRGFEDRNIRVLLGTRDANENVDVSDRAGRTNIDDAIDKFIQVAGPKDTLILAFSGHGVRIPDKDGRGDRSYFCPVDGNPEKADTLIDLKTLYEKLQGCGAATKLLFVDACQSVVPGAKEVLPSNVPSLSKRDFAGRPQNTAAFFGCAIGHKSYEAEQLKHGIFMHCIIEAFRSETAALDKDTGDVTIDSLGRYIKEQVPLLCIKCNLPPQTPTMSYDDPIFKTVLVSLMKYQTLLKQSSDLLKRRDYDEAMVKADKAVELGQQDYATWLWRARLRENRSVSRSMVIDDATRAIDLLERPSKAVTSDRAFDRAIAYEIRGRNRHVEAKKSKVQPKAAPNKLDEGLKQAEDDLAKCIASLPVEEWNSGGEETFTLYFQALMERAEIARARKDVRLGRQCLDDIDQVKFPPSFWESATRRFRFYLLLVQFLNDEGDYAAALRKIDALFSAAIEIQDPRGHHALVYLEEGRTSRGLGDTGQAIAKLKNAIYANPKLDEAIDLLGNVYLETGQFKEAERLFEKANKEKSSFERNLGLALAFRGQQDLKKAIGYLDEALLRTPNSAEAYRLRAELRQQTGDIAGADADRRRAGELAPGASGSSKK